MKKISLKRDDFVEVVTIFGKTKKCIVIKGGRLFSEGKNSSGITLTDISNDKALKISYPQSYIKKIRKLKKSDLLFYINLKNKYIEDVIHKMYTGKYNAELQL